MHIKTYKTPIANAVMRLCWERKRSDDFKLIRKAGDEWEVNANGLSNAMLEKVPQSTITRLLNGSASEIQTVKSIADFFEVDITVSGEIISSPIAPRAQNVIPIESTSFLTINRKDFEDLPDFDKGEISGFIKAKIAENQRKPNSRDGNQPR